MNRIEFMTELAALLQDVPVEERHEAMKYYNDYFDDAGVENEEKIIKELGSPARVASMIKADLQGSSGNSAEYSETGYKDSRFDRRDMPAGRDRYTYDREEQPKTSGALKIALIILIVIFGGPVLIPLGIVIAVSIILCILAAFLVFVVFVIASICLTIGGIILFCAGIATLFPAFAVGLALVGTGLIITVLGVIATVGSVKLCIVALPGMVRGLVWLCRRPFEGRAVA